jgi:thiamine kinase-like enzyme
LNSLGSPKDVWISSVIALARKAGFDDDTNVSAIRGGANNRVYEIEEKGRKALLKQYFRHPSDPRDRLKAEFTFTQFAWDRGSRSVPQPLARDDGSGLAIYEWIEGRLLEPREVTEEHVDEALRFFLDVNKNKSGAAHLGVASEACFSLKEHIETVNRRVSRLLHIQQKTAVDRKALVFVRQSLQPTWDAVKERAIEEVRKRKVPIDEEILMEDRCISPSDFGFHNALLSESGFLRFIDFEYAGWDDPCKVVCDFFYQPKVPAPMTSYDRFAEEIVAELSDPPMYRARIGILLPVYRIKWCCILLNNFLQVGAERRKFADEEPERDVVKERQLQKAVILLHGVKEEYRRGGI